MRPHQRHLALQRVVAERLAGRAGGDDGVTDREHAGLVAVSPLSMRGGIASS